MRNAPWAATSTLGIISAAVSALTCVCCAVPALTAAIVAVLGVSGSVALASLAPYRLWMLSISAVLLAFSVYTSFRTPCARVARAFSTTGVAVWLVALAASLAAR